MRHTIVKGLALSVIALACFLLVGCTTPNAGGEARSVYIENSPNAYIHIEGDGNAPSTAAPETGEQTTNGATVSPEVEVPVIP